MKIKINQAFTEAIALAAKATPKRPSHPVLGCLKVIAQEMNQVTITGFDLSIGITRYVQTEVLGGTGGICLPAGLISEIVKEIKDEPEAVLEVNPSTHECVLVVGPGDTRFKLQGTRTDEYPEFPKSEDSREIVVSPKGLTKALDAVEYSVSTDQTKGVLMGIHFNLTKAELAATDGHRLGVCPFEFAGESSELTGFTLPSAAVAVIKSALDSDDNDVSISVDREGSNIKINVGKTLITSRAVSGNYPSYGQLIPREFESSITLNTQEFYTALKRVAIVSIKGKSAIKLSGSATPLGINQVDLSSDTADVAGVKTSVLIQEGSIGEDIAFNIKYLIDAVNHIKTPQVTLHMNTPTSPVIVTPYSGDTEAIPQEKHLVMPIQIRNL